jgi:hypothetical protein
LGGRKYYFRLNPFTSCKHYWHKKLLTLFINHISSFFVNIFYFLIIDWSAYKPVGSRIVQKWWFVTKCFLHFEMMRKMWKFECGWNSKDNFKNSNLPLHARIVKKLFVNWWKSCWTTLGNTILLTMITFKLILNSQDESFQTIG